MNRYQRLVITVAIIDLIVILLFPPFVERTLARNSLTSFDGFYFLLSEFGRRSLDTSLLSLQVIWITANALSAWLALDQPGPTEQTDQAEHRRTVGIGLFTVVNLAIICLFPPFEQYNSLLRSTAPGFDSFYFLFGDRSARPLFWPLLQLEVFFVLINALALHLLFNAIKRGEQAERERQAAIQLNAGWPPEAHLSHLQTPEQRQLAEQRRAELIATLGRKEDRRHQETPNFRGRERRARNRRTHE